MPTKRSVQTIKSNLLKPALTSHFEVSIPVPTKLTEKEGNNSKSFLEYNGVYLTSTNTEQLQLLCSEATLPGSNIATLELTNDFHGVTERHAHRRVYDDRIDLTFYVDAENYLPIRFFETWIKFIVDESVSSVSTKNVGSKDMNYFYRVRYPDDYTAKQGLKVTKFERDYKSILDYDFIGAFPISISSMPVSYDSSSLLKCTVSMTYIRYVLNIETVVSNSDSNTGSTAPTQPLNSDPSLSTQTSPQTQAEFNAQSLGTIVTNEYYNNFGFNEQNATNSGDFFNGSVSGPFGTAIG